MDQGLNGSSTTSTTITLIDDSNDSIGSNSLVGSEVYSVQNHDQDSDDILELSTNTTFSQMSQISHSYADSVEKMRQNTTIAGEMITHQIYNYARRKLIEFEHLLTATCEDICIDFSRHMGILPNCRYLFGLRVFHAANVEEEWALPGQPLRPNATYCFRMRFKVPSLDVNLRFMDPAAYEYLYNQMHYDIVHECIPEIQYPLKKDNIMGLGAVTMYIDLLEQRNTAEAIEKNYKRFLPRRLVKTHKIFGKSKICQTFRDLCKMQLNVVDFKWSYINEVDRLAPNYMLETYIGLVDFIPCDDGSTCSLDDGNVKNFNETRAYIKLDLHDTLEPGLKVARVVRNEELQWKLVTKLENIYGVYVKGNKLSAPCCRLEITGMPSGYGIKFDGRVQLESFISYLSGYMRLTTKWMVDVCVQYVTPSLNELLMLRCHGPIGGAFSFAKILKRGDNCGSYIIRQCEKEYDTYYIDINTKSYRAGLQPEKYKTETFKITKKLENDEVTKKPVTKWILHYNSVHKIFDKLTDLAQFIPAESDKRFRIPPSDYDKSPLLLICLPKHVQMQKNKKELNETELQRRHVQILYPPRDLQWYHNSRSECDNGRFIKMRADWIQQGGFKDINVTLKILKRDDDFQTFINLANCWSRVSSPHILKLYGLTLTRPYSLVMEYSKFGALNEFLMHYKSKVSLRQLLDVVQGLVRGLVYLQEHNIIHGFIRCCNLYVTKFDMKSQLLEAKLSDPGLRRSYNNDDLPWIPFEYHNNLCNIEKDISIDIWAFGTTVWEIFARGKAIGPVTAKTLRMNYNRYGGILPMPSDDCPQEMLQVMMDGWSTDPDNNFNHMQIFQRLIFVKENLDNDYTTIDGHSDDMMVEDESNGLENAEQQPESAEHEPPNGVCQKVGTHRSYFDITPSVLEIKNGKVIFKNKIGEGHFGIVHLGEVRYNTSTNASEMVAIKTLKSLRTSQLNDDFMREIEIMETLDHPNIVKIKHWIQRPFCIIMEFLESGSFLVYLTSHKPNLTNQKLLNFAMDIAKGMNYLVKKNIIHRDLAARNILVDRDSVKISDFGLAQKADSNGYYIGHSKRKIPIKWYSPETIRSNAKFSFQSDVWSYGVTLFEIFSRGEPPNLEPDKELSQDEFLLRLEKGERLQKPALCPNNIYEQLMWPCWQHNPKLRPTFQDIINTIKSIASESLNTNCINATT